MKKAGYVMIIITVMISVFVCGYLLGRNANRADITVLEPSTSSVDTSTSASTSNKININTASVAELTLLPGIGQALAQRIVDYRTTISPFHDVTDLSNVEGIGEQKLLGLIDYITV